MTHYRIGPGRLSTSDDRLGVFFHSILVSVTEVCTVGCRHCGFTGSTRDRQPHPDELASWVSQACEYGIPEIIFTGGEPFQRFMQLKSAVRAAAKHHPRPAIAVFTSSFWGRKPDTVGRLLGQLEGLSHLYLSTDVYHQERVPSNYVVNVIDGAIRANVEDITLCVTVAEDQDAHKVTEPYQKYQDRVALHIERVIPTPMIRVGKVAGQPPDPEHYRNACYLETPLINPNGDVSACHIGKAGAYVPLQDLPYYLGNLRTNSFQEIMSMANGNYEYQFLRVYGPQGVARLVAESPSLKAEVGGRTFTNGCDLCYKVLRSPAGRRELQRRIGDPLEREIVDALRQVRFNEVVVPC